jgi:hypothetical protein
MKIKNISNKIIGIGSSSILPGETQTVPAAYESSPILAIYAKSKLAEITETGKSERAGKKAEETETDNSETQEQDDSDAAENLRKARLASLNGISEEDLGKLANELGINPADCKDQADVLKKVKAALKKQG